jgi:hypothetical protein
LDGILRHESIIYEGIARPTEIIRAFDRPKAKKGSDEAQDLDNPENRKVLSDYWNDLYGLFMRKLSQFIIEPQIEAESEVKLQAMLQELVKVKRLLAMPEKKEEVEKEG